MHSPNVLLTQYNFWKLIILFYLDNNFDISQHYPLSSEEFTVINIQKDVYEMWTLIGLS